MISRRGLSLVEVLVASAIVAVCLTSIFSGLSGARDQVQRMDVLLTGRLLAQSVVDSVRHRLNVRDRRFYKLETTPAELTERVARDDWQRPFRVVEQARARVLPAPGATGAGGGNGWAFDPADGPVLPAGLRQGEERAFWESFAYEVRVGFDVAIARGAPRAIDADGDGRGEIDLARIEVEIFWDPPGRPAEARSVCRMVTLAVAPDKTPGLGTIAHEAGP